MKTELHKAKVHAKKAIHQTEEVVETAAFDIKKLAKTAVKIAIPLVLLKMIHSRYKKTKVKANHWEKVIVPLFEELKSKLKDR